jgi:hypothetical protein
LVVPPLCHPQPITAARIFHLALAGALGMAQLFSLPSMVYAEGRGQDAVDSRPFTLPLECRIGQGPWQPCRMLVEQVGLHWYLLIGDQQVEFRHDGRGMVRQRQKGSWRTVTSRWEADTSLCWDGYCARGDIPLD